MEDLLKHKDDFGLMLGITDIDSALDSVISTIWVPYWKNLPAALRTPRRLLEDKGLVYSMLEGLGTRIMSERADLEDQLKAHRADAVMQRESFLRSLATMAEFSASCAAFNVSYEADDLDLDEPFLVDSSADASDDMPDPLWKVCITLVGARGTKRLTNILTHQEFVMHFSSVATVVDVDPDPDFVSELEDAFNAFAPKSMDDMPFDDGPTLR